LKRRSGNAAREKIVEACATIAIAVSQTRSGAAHTVQLMLRDPSFRANAIAAARGRVATAELSSPTEGQLAAEQDVHSAAYELSRYAGVPL
jgi:hypothetical protein